MMVRGTYWLTPRSNTAEHQHPYLVFDVQDRLHFHLTVFGKEAVARMSEGTARTYLYAILPFFTYLDTDTWQCQAQRIWNASTDQVRQAIDDYLVQILQCKVQEHRFGFQVVSVTSSTRSTIRVFLSGLKLFYSVMKQQGYYHFRHPLIDPVSALYAVVEEQEEETLNESPHMPDISGVVAPRRKARLSDSYFKLEGETWVPQIVDDSTLPAQILAGGKKIGWSLREECVTRILFESGGRISEVVGLTLADWVARGTLQEASSFSKGSHGRRVKFLRFSSATAKLLRRYFDEERRQYDPNGWTLADYLQSKKRDQDNLENTPLFLSIQRTPLSAKTFRENFWNSACNAAQIDVDIHQCRHWYVTMVVRQIYETAKTEGDVKRRLRELIEYIKWKQGWQTMEAYEHYFDAARHADIQDAVHHKMDEVFKETLEQRKNIKTQNPQGQTVQEMPLMSISRLIPDDPDYDFLRSIGGSSNEN